MTYALQEEHDHFEGSAEQELKEKIHKRDCACVLCEQYRDDIRASMETL